MENDGNNTNAQTGANTQGNNAVTQTVNNAQTKTEGTVTQTVNKTEGDQKTFTQEEVNAMLAKEKKKISNTEEMKAFKEWQEAQKTAEQKQKEDVVKMQNLENDNNFKTQIVEIMKKGISYDDAEFIQFKVSKMEGVFSDNLEEYLKNNTKYTAKEDGKKTATTTGFSQTRTNTVVDTNKDYLDQKYKNNPYYKK